MKSFNHMLQNKIIIRFLSLETFHFIFKIIKKKKIDKSSFLKNGNIVKLFIDEFQYKKNNTHAKNIFIIIRANSKQNTKYKLRSSKNFLNKVDK